MQARTAVLYAMDGAAPAAGRSALCDYGARATVPQRDIPRFIALHQAGLLPVETLLTRTIALDAINPACDALARGEAVRQVVRFS